MACLRTALVSLALFLCACTSGTVAPVQPAAIAGNWQGLAAGGVGPVDVALKITQSGSAVTCELSLPTIPGIEKATGWGTVDGASFSLALTDKLGRSIFVTGVVDATGAELSGEIAVADDKDKLTFDLFKQ